MTTDEFQAKLLGSLEAVHTCLQGQLAVQRELVITVADVRLELCEHRKLLRELVVSVLDLQKTLINQCLTTLRSA